MLAAQSSREIDGAKSLVNRVLPRHTSEVVVEPLRSETGKDTFEVETIRGRLHIRGNSSVAVGAGLNWYFQNVAHVTMSWGGDQMNLPKRLPPVLKKIRIASPFKYRYNLNYCTLSYSMAFWDWGRWERELDWMALHGINLTLATTGTEAVWQRTLRRFNFSEEEIKAFIPGPGFTAWWLMGNLEGWGGPVSQAWIDGQVRLQQRILARMSELGMKPVFQGFYGMVPDITRKKFPDAAIKDQGDWYTFKFRRPAILLPGDPLFAEMSRVYYDELRKLYGEAQFFGGDPFHEGGSTKGIDLLAAAGLIQKAMAGKQPDAVWVLQGWQVNPRDELLSGLDKKRSLVLDLANDRYPQWKKRNAWSGHPWVYSIVSNFGENTGLFGRLDLIAKDLPAVMADPKKGELTGIGIMLEGINNNPVVYDHLLSFGWDAKAPANLDEWIKNYAHYRYGRKVASIESAWDILRKTVYNAPPGRDNGNESVFCARPTMKFKSAATWGSGERYYEPRQLVKALGLMLQARHALKKVDTYRYDVTDITRQVISDLGRDVHVSMIEAYEKKDAKRFEEESSRFLELMKDHRVGQKTRAACFAALDKMG